MTTGSSRRAFCLVWGQGEMKQDALSTQTGPFIMGTSTPSQSAGWVSANVRRLCWSPWRLLWHNERGISGTYYRQSHITSQIGSQQVGTITNTGKWDLCVSPLPRPRWCGGVMLWCSPVYLFCMETCWGVLLQFEEVSELGVFRSS